MTSTKRGRRVEAGFEASEESFNCTSGGSLGVAVLAVARKWETVRETYSEAKKMFGGPW